MATIIEAPRALSAYRSLEGRIGVGPSHRLLPAIKRGEGGIDINEIRLLAIRDVTFDGDIIGTATRLQRHGRRNGDAANGFPTEWFFTDLDGVSYENYAHRSLSHTLYEVIGDVLKLGEK